MRSGFITGSMNSRIDALEKNMQQVQVDLNAHIKQVQTDLQQSFENKQMMTYMIEHIEEGGESSSHALQGRGTHPTYSLTYADDDGAMYSMTRALQQHAHIHVNI